MNTPAHLLLGAALFGRRGGRRTLGASMLGALAPDLSLYVMAGVSLFLLGIPPQIVFDELYFSPAWQTVFAIDNSVFVWGALLSVALVSRRDWAIALTAAALLHLALDFPLHHDDGRPHFWPVSGWIFESPISYWDMRRGAGWIGPLEAAVSCVAAFFIWRSRPGLWLSALVALLLMAELRTVVGWFHFVDGT